MVASPRSHERKRGLVHVIISHRWRARAHTVGMRDGINLDIHNDAGISVRHPSLALNGNGRAGRLRDRIANRRPLGGERQGQRLR